MSLSKGTPASSQIVWLEQRVKELEAERDVVAKRYRHVIRSLRRDGYWAAFMEDDEIDAQIDEEINTIEDEWMRAIK